MTDIQLLLEEGKLRMRLAISQLSEPRRLAKSVKSADEKSKVKEGPEAKKSGRQSTVSIVETKVTGRSAVHVSASRFSCSPVRSHHSTRNNGMSERAKKRGPPCPWTMLWIMCGPSSTQRRPIIQMRKPLRTIESGMTKATRTARRHGLFKKEV